MSELFDVILKGGIKKYNDTTKVPNKTGAVFVVRSKDDFATMRGRIVMSLEQLTNTPGTHWTPNVYRQYKYTDVARTRISGFEESNLLQVNVFVIDIDTHKHSVNDILLACLDNSIGTPSFVIKTTRGYQVGFNLSKPMYMSNVRNKIGFKVAKRIAHNLKRSLAIVDADLFCNDFGFFRMPTKENLVYSHIENTYTPQHFIQWSQQFDNGKPLYVRNQATSTKLTQSEWFKALVNLKNVRGMKGRIGRNNLLFTIALTCFADSLPEDAAATILLDTNSHFADPLKNREIQTIITSAYSGKYKGPAQEYVEAFLSMFGINMNVRLNHKWYKHKKDRSERVRSHLKEWEQDLEKFLIAQPEAVEMSQNELCKAIGIPRASLNKLISQSRKFVKHVTGVGRNAKTAWTTLAQFAQQIINTIHEKKMAYSQTIKEINDTLLDIFGYKMIERLIQLNAIDIYDNKLSTVP